MCNIPGRKICVVWWPLDLEDQIHITHINLDLVVLVEEDPGEMVSGRRIFAIILVADGCFCSRCVLKYDLSSLVECDAEVLTAEPTAPFAQEHIVDLWIASEHITFLEGLRLTDEVQL